MEEKMHSAAEETMHQARHQSRFQPQQIRCKKPREQGILDTTDDKTPRKGGRRRALCSSRHYVWRATFSLYRTKCSKRKLQKVGTMTTCMTEEFKCSHHLELGQFAGYRGLNNQYI